MELEIIKCIKNKKNYEITVNYLEENSLKFYIDGKGGQLGDRGHIGEAKVLEVLPDKIIIDRELEVGKYSYSIDMKRREDIAVQHTAEHLFSGVATKYFGLHNVGFRMAEEVTTVDLDSDNISEETVKELEKKVNEVIKNGAKVIKKNVTIPEAKELPLRKPLSEKIKEGLVRIVEIENYDFCACAGFHLKNIQEARVLKILSHERIKGKYTRFYLLAGDRAIGDYNKKSEVIKELNHKFSCRDNEIIEMLEKYMTEHENLKRAYGLLNQKYSKNIFETLIKTPTVIKDKKIVIYEDEKDVINEVRKYFSDRDETFIGISDGAIMLSSNTLNCNEIIKKIIEKKNTLKGGGSQNQGNIKGTATKEEIMELLNNIL